MVPRSKLLTALAIGSMLFAGAALAENPGHGDHGMMGSGGMSGMTKMMESMTRMMDGCARMMQTSTPEPNENQGAPAPGEAKPQ